MPAGRPQTAPLNWRFRPAENYDPPPYRLLPFRFLELDPSRCVLTSLAGEHLVVSRADLQSLVRGDLDRNSALFCDLSARQIISSDRWRTAEEVLAVKYRTRQAALPELTGLHIFVVSLRCEHTCQYCQVSRQTTDRLAFDMSAETAVQAVDFAFRSPSRSLKIEFQGGEPLLNFERVVHITRLAQERALADGRDIEFVLCSNLALLDDAVLDFLSANRFLVSTSLDGPAALHNQQRPRRGRDSYQRTIEGIRRARNRLGPDRVGALMTTTPASLRQARPIIDEYLAQGFDSIFLRPISPYGFAAKASGLAQGYTTGEWLAFYEEGFRYILDLNAHGITFREDYASILLQKILTPYGSGYVDLQSPAGTGIGALVYNYDGDIYASDEGRMLAEMGDTRFRLGHLGRHSYEEVMTSPALLGPIMESMTEGAPGCVDCGLQPYCGSDPVFHHATQGDPVGYKPASAFCERNMALLRLLITILEDEPQNSATLRSWVRA